MGDFGKGKGNLTAYLSTEKKDYIIARGERLGWSKSKYAGAIIDRWFEAGCPAVSEVEQSLAPMPFQELGGSLEKRA